MSKDKVNLALIQLNLSNKDSTNKQKVVEAIKQAASNGVDLILLSELHQSEYFCQYESVDNFALAKRYKEDVELFSSLARDNKVVLLASLFEQRARGLYHNSAIVFEKDGSIAGQYRKMHIPDDPNFYEKFYFTPGDLGFKPIKTSVGVLGVLICWDQWYPEAARIMALKGAEILIYPTAIAFSQEDSKDEKARQLASWEIIQKSHAIANGIFVASINRVGFEEDRSRASSGLTFFGSSFVAGPQGEILAKASDTKEEILYTSIDFSRIEQVRNIWPFLRDRRIESYGDILKRYDD